MKESVIDAGLALGKMLTSALEGVDVLPQAQLEQLVAHGRLVSVTTFEDHMRPDVHWIEPEEYGKSFDELIAEGNIMAGQEAAFTSATQSYPGYVNIPLADWDAFLVQAQRVRAGTAE